MDPDSNTVTESENATVERAFSRDFEASTFTDTLPISGVTKTSQRVFNVWGEKGVGKTHFIASVRESELMHSKKVLWLRIGDSESIDSVQEFIMDCSESVRYPMSPAKEKNISKRIEAAQRGKINPMKSDDELLITRSSIAKKKKPYINQAAAASVGRTEIIREEIQLDVGFEKNELNNQAEAFLDALPLQSLGTDLIAIHIQDLEKISITVRDWIKDYLIPAATKGSFRRSLIFIVESSEPSQYHHDSISWGLWNEHLSDYRLHPLSEDGIYSVSIDADVSPAVSRFIYTKSQGYPRQAMDLIAAAQNGAFTNNRRSAAVTLLSSLPEEDRPIVAACCLPDKLYPDELDAIFGKGQGKRILKWLSGYRQIPFRKDSSGKALIIEDDFRHIALHLLREDPEFKRLRTRWSPYGRLLKFSPNKVHRSKVLLLCGLNWFDKFACDTLFGEKSDQVLQFAEDDENHFIRKRGFYRLTTCLRTEAAKVAESMGHTGIVSIQKNAFNLWEERSEELRENAQSLKAQIIATQEALNNATRRHAESTTQIRKFGLPGTNTFNEHTLVLARKKSKLGPFFGLTTLSAVSFGISQALPSPSNIMPMVAGIASLVFTLSLLPGIIAHYKAKALVQRSLHKDSPEHLHKENIHLHHEMQRHEVALEDLQTELEKTQRLLEYAYV